MNIFSANSLLGRFLNLIGDLVILNILWIVFSLPIFTIGASTTALFYSLMIRIRRDEGYVHTNFIKSFKQNFKQSTIIWLIMAFILFILLFDYRIGIYLNSIGNNIVGGLFIVISVVLLIIYYLVLTYIFPVQAKFENTLKNNFKNAFLMSIAHFGYTILIFIITMTFILLSLASKAIIGIEIFLGMSLYAYLTSNIYIMVFRKHLPEEIEDDEEASGINNIY